MSIHRTIGIDISKDWLDVFAAPEGRASRFSNDPTGLRKLIAWIGSEVERIAYEPTGPFHRNFEDALLKAGLPLYAINPFQVRSFARSLGRRAKTDAVDARVLATMAAAIEDLRPTHSKSEGQRDLAELQLVRDALVGDRVAITNRGKHLRTPVAKQLNKQRLKQIERQIKRVDAEIRKRLKAEGALERQSEILTSIPGISDVTAAGLIVHMPELGTLTGSCAASLAGLAPVTRESGSWKGRSFIQGGRHHVRRLLYMPALVASRCNPDLKRTYEVLVANGKPPKVALTAVMRKLLVLANVLIQQGRAWTPRMNAMHPTGKQGQTAPSASSRLTQRPHPAFTATVHLPCLPGPAPDGALLTWILLLERIDELDEKIYGLDKKLRASAREDEETARLMTIPGIGPITALAIQAFAPPMESFRRGRDFSAWLGLVPRQHTTGGKPRLGRISKMGQRDLRRLLITGAMTVVHHAIRRGETTDPWLARMLARKPRMLVAVALANRMARIVWALTTKKEIYRAHAAAA